MAAMKIMPIACLIMFIDGHIHLYNTIVRNDLDERNCLYEMVLQRENGHSQLLTYCARHDPLPTETSDQRCHEQRNHTFAELLSKNITGADLFHWFAPIDTISDYERFRLDRDSSLSATVFCNCTNHWFGPFCQYKVFDSLWSSAFGLINLQEIIDYQMNDRESLSGAKDLSFMMCYEGLRCHAAICLDWRQICDGVLNCEHGEDEPEQCLLLELNQCQSDEYRCRSGMCVAKKFLLDFDFECPDGSDEQQSYKNQNRWVCSGFPSWICDTRMCPPGQFSCGDGACSALTGESRECATARDNYFRQQMLGVHSSFGNLSRECRSAMVCASEAATVDFRTCSNNLTELFRRFRNSCPSLFEFEDHRNLLYPFVRFVYDQRINSSSTWREPSYFCFNRSACANVPYENLTTINGLTCLRRDRVRAWPNDSTILPLIFSACRSTSPLVANRSGELFLCEKSRKFIGKERVNDDIVDCFFGEDEWEGRYSTVVRTLPSSNRFKCLYSDQWILSVFAGHQTCADGSDAWYIDECRKVSDISCQIRRGTYSPSLYYTFQENCNGAQLISRPILNETDESHCEQWPSVRLCDSYWDLDNGTDELNCSLTVAYYIRRTVLQCAPDEHYCWFENGTRGCLHASRAGDGHRDCLGNTDERRALSSCLYRVPDDPFQCASGVCVPLYYLCDGVADCADNDDEVICPWMRNVTLKPGDRQRFSRNGTEITRALRCNQQVDFPPAAEDEWFCDLKYIRSKQLLLDSLEPQYQQPEARSQETLPLARTTSAHPWYCNLGLLVSKRLSTKLECLCPPSFYGLRCEYQSERIAVLVHMDVMASLSRHRNKQRLVRLLACLLLNETIVRCEHFLRTASHKYAVYLLYPRPPPKANGHWSVRLDAFLVDSISVEYEASWSYDVPFPFLPVSRLTIHLLLNSAPSCRTLRCQHGHCRQYLNPPHHAYCQCHEHWSGSRCEIPRVCACAPGGRCVARATTPICICPLGRFGHRCEGWFAPCRSHICKNGATCVPLDQRQEPRYLCLCSAGYSGIYCDLKDNRLDLYFSASLLSRYFSQSTAMFTHVLRLNWKFPGVFFTADRRLIDFTSSATPLTMFYRNSTELTLLLLLEVCVERDRTDFYVAHLARAPPENVTSVVYPRHQCLHVDQIIVNRTIQQFPSIRKVKYYHHLCLLRMDIHCLVDELHLCFCDPYRQLECGVLLRESTRCSLSYCQNNGRCVQNNYDGIWDFRCVCQSCTFGSLCQLTTSEYALSLDLMLGQDILQTVSIKHQPILVHFVLTMLLVMLFFGTVSNILSFLTLKQPKVREHGCGLYLLCLPLIGQLGLSVLVGRFSYLLTTQISDVEHRLTAHWSCMTLEYVLNVCPTLFDWLTTSVAIERCVNIIQGVKFNKSISTWWAKRIIAFLSTAVLTSSWHEFFSHQLIDDPRSTTLHTWCVVVFRWSWLKYYRLAVNLIHLTIPCLLQLVATLFLLHRSTQMKQTLAVKKEHTTYGHVLKKQLPLYGSPYVLIIVSMIRLIFSFTLACIVHPWQKYLYLMAYCISFFPLMATFPIFILPAKLYRDEFRNVREQINGLCKIKLFN